MARNTGRGSRTGHGASSPSRWVARDPAGAFVSTTEEGPMTGHAAGEVPNEQAIRLAEASGWMATVEQLQQEVSRLRALDERRLAMVQLHCGWAEGSADYQCSGGCGAWPCATYLACYPEEAWRRGEFGPTS